MSFMYVRPPPPAAELQARLDVSGWRQCLDIREVVSYLHFSQPQWMGGPFFSRIPPFPHAVRNNHCHMVLHVNRENSVQEKPSHNRWGLWHRAIRWLAEGLTVTVRQSKGLDKDGKCQERSCAFPRGLSKNPGYQNSPRWVFPGMAKRDSLLNSVLTSTLPNVHSSPDL